MTEPDLGELLGRTVRVRPGRLRVGAVTGVFGDASFERVIGLEVSSPDGRRRFLPWVVSSLDGHGVRVQSAFLLVDPGELDAYLRLGARLVREPAELDGLAATPDGRIERLRDGGVLPELVSGTQPE